MAELKMSHFKSTEYIMPLWQIYVIGLLLCSFLIGILPVAYAQQSNEYASTPNLDLLVLVDESTLMWLQNDRERKRLEAFDLLVDTLAIERPPDDDFVRLAMIAFGSADLTKVVMDFRPVNTGTAEDIKRHYREYVDALKDSNGQRIGLGRADVLSALELAETVLNARSPAYKPAIVIFSGGEVTFEGYNRDGALDAYSRQVRAQAARFHSPYGGPFYYPDRCSPLEHEWTPIYTIAIRQGHELADEYQQIWRDLATQNGGAYFASPGGLSLEGLGGLYYSILIQLSCQNYDRLYEVHNLYKRITFTTPGGNLNDEVKIYRPGSEAPLTADDPSVSRNQVGTLEEWVIEYSEPWAGVWTVESNDLVSFDCELFTDGLYIKIERPPDLPSRACQGIDVALRITNQQGAAITAHVRNLELQVKTPDGGEQSFDDIQPQNDIFRQVYTDTCTEGDYEFLAIATVFNGESESRLTEDFTVQVVLEPYLQVISPVAGHDYDPRKPIVLQADIKVGEDFADGIAVGKPTVTASVLQDVRTVDEFELEHAGTAENPTRMTRVIPANTLEEGDYTIVFTLQTLDGQYDVSGHRLSVKEEAVDSDDDSDEGSLSRDTIRKILIGSVIMLIVGVIMLIVWGIRKARGRNQQPNQSAKTTRDCIREKFNPYICERPITEPGMFFGRQEILDDILSGIHGSNYAICGPQRIGKTSLLHRIEDCLSQKQGGKYDYWPIFISIQGVSENQFFADLMGWIVADLVKKGKYTSNQSLRYHQGKVGGKVYDNIAFHQDLGVLFSSSPPESMRVVVLLVDEGDALNKYAQSTLAKLRSVFMENKSLRIVLSREAKDGREWKLPGSPWESIFGPRHFLQEFSSEEALRLIKEPVQHCYRYQPEAIELILERSGLLPRNIQNICYQAVAEMLAGDDRSGKIALGHVGAALKKVQGLPPKSVPDIPIDRTQHAGPIDGDESEEPIDDEFEEPVDGDEPEKSVGGDAPGEPLDGSESEETIDGDEPEKSVGGDGAEELIDGDEPGELVLQKVITYEIGGDFQRLYCNIDSAGDVVGSCGVFKLKNDRVGNSDKVVALEIWLYNQKQQLAKKVLLSEYCFSNAALCDQLASKDEAVLITPGENVELDVLELKLQARVLEMEYGVGGGLPPRSSFSKVTLELMAWFQAT